MADQPVEPAVPVEAEPQLTQARVPMAEAADAFAVPDESGRFPIVVVTGERSRIRNELVIAGLALLAVVFIVQVHIVLQGGLVAAGVALIVLGTLRAFIVRVPEGAQALALRRGRYERTLPAGVHYLPPWIAVSHVVTTREIPFLAAGLAVPTADDVRLDVGVLITFTIQAADRFVYAISAPDFDTVCMAASQDAIRRLIRSIGSEHVLDLAGTESEAIRGAIGEGLASYGVSVDRVVITSITPPAAYMQSLEARRLAEVQQAELAERHTLDRRRQADRLELERGEIEGRRRLLELEAENEAFRLKQAEARIAAYPRAAQWDFDAQRLEVARALAANDRALLAVGDPARLTEALLMAATPEPESDGGGAARTDTAGASPRGGAAEAKAT